MWYCQVLLFSFLFFLLIGGPANNPVIVQDLSGFSELARKTSILLFGYSSNSRGDNMASEQKSNENGNGIGIGQISLSIGDNGGEQGMSFFSIVFFYPCAKASGLLFVCFVLFFFLLFLFFFSPIFLGHKRNTISPLDSGAVSEQLSNDKAVQSPPKKSKLEKQIGSQSPQLNLDLVTLKRQQQQYEKYLAIATARARDGTITAMYGTNGEIDNNKVNEFLADHKSVFDLNGTRIENTINQGRVIVKIYNTWYKGESLERFYYGECSRLWPITINFAKHLYKYGAAETTEEAIKMYV